MGKQVTRVRASSMGRLKRTPRVRTCPRGQRSRPSGFLTQIDSAVRTRSRASISVSDLGRECVARTARSSARASLLSSPGPADRGKLPHFPPRARSTRPSRPNPNSASASATLAGSTTTEQLLQTTALAPIATAPTVLAKVKKEMTPEAQAAESKKWAARRSPRV
jgi:hypothetical protein